MLKLALESWRPETMLEHPIAGRLRGISKDGYSRIGQASQEKFASNIFQVFLLSIVIRKTFKHDRLGWSLRVINKKLVTGHPVLLLDECLITEVSNECLGVGNIEDDVAIPMR